MKKAQRKNVVVEPLAKTKPGVCPKCADRYKAWSVSFCGPEQRLSSCLLAPDALDATLRRDLLRYMIKRRRRENADQRADVVYGHRVQVGRVSLALLSAHQVNRPCWIFGIEHRRERVATHLPTAAENVNSTRIPSSCPPTTSVGCPVDSQCAPAHARACQ